MKQLPKDIEVQIEFLRSEHGGRKTAAFSGYRPQFFYNGQDWDAVHNYIGTETAEPGQRVKANLAFMSPQAHEGNIYPSMPFLVREGNRVIGFGSVTKIIELPQSASRMRENT
jgi:translation elongation factor EF-Tu-like GTPase